MPSLKTYRAMQAKAALTESVATSKMPSNMPSSAHVAIEQPSEDSKSTDMPDQKLMKSQTKRPAWPSHKFGTDGTEMSYQETHKAVDRDYTPPQAGKKTLAAVFDGAAIKVLKIYAAEKDRTVQSVIAEALNDFLSSKGKGRPFK
jgi:hypothetical protein